MKDIHNADCKGHSPEMVEVFNEEERKSREEEKYFRREYGPRKSRAAANPVAKKATEKRKAQRKRAKAARRANR